MADYSITEDDVQRIAGKEAIDDAADLVRSLYKQQSVKFSYRIAPSVLSRGEAALFGLDAPRFAVRATFLDLLGRASFLTIRLANVVQLRLDVISWFVARPNDFQPGICWKSDGQEDRFYAAIGPWDDDSKSPRAAYAAAVEGHYIADCALVPPPHYEQTHLFLGSHLAQQYGDASAERSTSYVHAIGGFSGAACIQAAALMSNAALADWPLDRREFTYPPMVSLGDVTALVAKQGRWVRLKGFCLPKLCVFFRAVGRSAFWHRVTLSADAFASLCSDHVLSGCPMILKVCLRNVLTTCDDGPPAHLKDGFDHAQVLVGCSKDVAEAANRDDCFLVHDPSVGPFIRASRDDLAFWMRVSNQLSDPYQFISVYPLKVRMPLADFFDDSATEPVRDGIKTLAHHLLSTDQYSGLASRLGFLGRDPGDLRKRSWQLVELFQTPGRHSPCESGQHDPFQVVDVHDEQLRKLWLALVMDLGIEGRYAWLYAFGQDEAPGRRAIAVWAADVDQTQVPKSIEKYLFFVIYESSPQQWRIAYDCARGIINDDVERKAQLNLQRAFVPVQTSGNLRLTIFDQALPQPNPMLQPGLAQMKVGLISSFRMIGIEDSLKNWPVGSDVPVELYVCPGEDPLLLMDNKKRRFPAELLADLNSEQGLITSVASRIDDAARHDGRTLSIHSLASFLPSLNRPRIRGQDSHSQPSDPLAGLIRIADALNSIPDGCHNVRTIELVAGSVSSGLLPTRDPEERGKTVLFQRLTLWQKAMTNIVRNIDTMLTNPYLRDLVVKNNLRFALELEPGPTYTMNGIKSLQFLSHLLSQHRFSRAQERVGINLDLAHFELAGLGPRDFHHWRTGPQRVPVCGVHISDHGTGHVSDLIVAEMAFGGSQRRLGSTGRLAPFREWIREIAIMTGESSVMSAPDSNPLGGTISVEFEAAPNDQSVKRSVRVVQELISSMQTPEGVPEQSPMQP